MKTHISVAMKMNLRTQKPRPHSNKGNSLGNHKTNNNINMNNIINKNINKDRHRNIIWFNPHLLQTL